MMDGLTRFTLRSKKVKELESDMTLLSSGSPENTSSRISGSQLEISKGKLFTNACMEDKLYVIETPDKSSLQEIPSLVIETTFEPFRTYFFKKAHFNFVCAQTYTFVSVLFTPKEGKHKALITSPKGQVAADVPEEALSAYKEPALPEQVLAYIEDKLFPNDDFYNVKDKSFPLELLGLEASHAQNATAFRIGIVYSKDLQLV